MADKPQAETQPSSPGMLVVRCGLGAAMIAGGVVMIILNPSGLGVDGFAMAVGGAGAARARRAAIVRNFDEPARASPRASYH